MEREEKPVCNICHFFFYAEGLLVQMSDLMVVILYVGKKAIHFCTKQAVIKVIHRWEPHSCTVKIFTSKISVECTDSNADFNEKLNK